MLWLWLLPPPDLRKWGRTLINIYTHPRLGRPRVLGTQKSPPFRVGSFADAGGASVLDEFASPSCECHALGGVGVGTLQLLHQDERSASALCLGDHHDSACLSLTVDLTARHDDVEKRAGFALFVRHDCASLCWPSASEKRLESLEILHDTCLVWWVDCWHYLLLCFGQRDCWHHSHYWSHQRLQAHPPQPDHKRLIDVIPRRYW